MNHIPKQQWMGCAVATAAMLASRSYEEVAAHWPDMDEDLSTEGLLRGAPAPRTSAAARAPANKR